MAALPTPEQAYAHLFDNVHARVFFGKLASFGIQPQSEKQASELLELAGKLKAAEQDPTVKAAAERNSPFAQASSDLDRQLGRMGVGKAAAAEQADIALNQAAAQLAQDPATYNAVLSLKAAEATQIAKQMGINTGQA